MSIHRPEKNQSVIGCWVPSLTERPDDSAIAKLYEVIGKLVVRFPLLHCEECASTVRRWLKQGGIYGKLLLS